MTQVPIIKSIINKKFSKDVKAVREKLVNEIDSTKDARRSKVIPQEGMSE